MNISKNVINQYNSKLIIIPTQPSKLLKGNLYYNTIDKEYCIYIKEDKQSEQIELFQNGILTLTEMRERCNEYKYRINKEV